MFVGTLPERSSVSLLSPKAGFVRYRVLCRRHTLSVGTVHSLANFLRPFGGAKSLSPACRCYYPCPTRLDVRRNTVYRQQHASGRLCKGINGTAGRPGSFPRSPRG